MLTNLIDCYLVSYKQVENCQTDYIDKLKASLSSHRLEL